MIMKELLEEFIVLVNIKYRIFENKQNGANNFTCEPRLGVIEEAMPKTYVEHTYIKMN